MTNRSGKTWVVHVKTQWVTFFIAGEEYCQNVEDVQEILNYEEPTPVPGAANQVTGILNVRGEVVTILSARCMLGLPELEPESTWRIITLQSHGVYYGLIVDAVHEMIDVDMDKLESAPGAAANSGNELIIGTYYHKDRLVIALDLNRYVENTEKHVDAKYA